MPELLLGRVSGAPLSGVGEASWGGASRRTDCDTADSGRLDSEVIASTGDDTKPATQCRADQSFTQVVISTKNSALPEEKRREAI
uniref:Uncharacterized protein SEN0015 n=1 Tax=Synechococcus elongatus (strain ATCC 33912 / PCC 7942 / FACHB-805) TaxID=1140 RepID=Q8GJM4_SYNE7|nr:unknown protein [Synechococcus elongatus PCC 7942 = FACHB-805]